jgi:hypothetical protein
LLKYPINMQNGDAYIAAEKSAEALDEAINNLKNAY